MTNSLRLYRRLGHRNVGFILLGYLVTHEILRYENGKQVSYDELFIAAQTKQLSLIYLLDPRF